MSDTNQNNTPAQQEYQDFAKKRDPSRPVLKNCILAFLSGGTICLLGQLISTFYMRFFDFTEKTAGDPTVATLIFLSSLLTGLGVYDKIAQWAGAGTIIPVTGFANAVTSSAIEHRSEGFVLGRGRQHVQSGRIGHRLRGLFRLHHRDRQGDLPRIGGDVSA